MNSLRNSFLLLVAGLLTALWAVSPNGNPLPLQASSNSVSGEIEFVGQIGGESNAVAVQGKYAYVGEGPTMTIFDISDVENPTIVSKTAALPGIVQDIILVGNYAYVAAGFGGLRIIDVTDTANPKEISFFDTPGFARAVAVGDDYAFVADKDGGLRIIKISEPLALTELDPIEYDSFVYDVSLAGDLIYIATGWNCLRIINISDPAEPSEVGFNDEPGYCRNVVILGNYAYISDGSQISIIDVSVPSTPTITGGVGIPCDGAYDLNVAGDYAYVPGNDLCIFNIADPEKPILAKKHLIPRFARSVAAAGNYAYATGGGLYIIDVSDKSAPLDKGSIKTPEVARSLDLADNYAYVTGKGVHIIDISNPALPAELGSVIPPEGAGKIAVMGDYAYITDGYGMSILNVADPNAPSFLSSEDTGGGRDIAVAGNYAYVATGGNGMHVVDVSDPSLPSDIGTYESNGDPQGIAVAGDYVYFLDWGLHIIDVSEPSKPEGLGFYVSWSGTDLQTNGGYIFMSAGDGLVWSGLRIIDISNPQAPEEASGHPMPDPLTSVALNGQVAYVASRTNIFFEPYFDSALSVVDAANPFDPLTTAFYDTPGYGRAVAADGDYIYFADENAGLLIFRYIPPTRGRIIVDKESEPAGINSPPFQFDFTGGPDAINREFDLASQYTPWDSGELKPGTYSVSETETSLWFLCDANCDDGSHPSNIQLKAGKTITCTFTNMKYEPPTAEFSASPISGPPPLTVNFTNLSNGDFDTCLWEFGDELTSSSCADQAHTYTNWNNYGVTLYVNGPGGSDWESSSIIVFEPPVADFSASPTSGPPPLTVTFHNLSSGGEIDRFLWDFGDGTTLNTLDDPVHTYTKSGNFQVSLTATGPGGEDTTAKKVNVLAEMFQSYMPSIVRE
jgi:PKD repeat protein